MKAETYKLFENSFQVATPKTRVLHILRPIQMSLEREFKRKHRENGGKNENTKYGYKNFSAKFSIVAHPTLKHYGKLSI